MTLIGFRVKFKKSKILDSWMKVSVLLKREQSFKCKSSDQFDIIFNTFKAFQMVLGNSLVLNFWILLT